MPRVGNDRLQYFNKFGFGYSFQNIEKVGHASRFGYGFAPSQKFRLRHGSVSVYIV